MVALYQYHPSEKLLVYFGGYLSAMTSSEHQLKPVESGHVI